MELNDKLVFIIHRTPGDTFTVSQWLWTGNNTDTPDPDPVNRHGFTTIEDAVDWIARFEDDRRFRTEPIDDDTLIVYETAHMDAA